MSGKRAEMSRGATMRNRLRILWAITFIGLGLATTSSSFSAEIVSFGGDPTALIFCRRGWPGYPVSSGSRSSRDEVVGNCFHRRQIHKAGLVSARHDKERKSQNSRRYL